MTQQKYWNLQYDTASKIGISLSNVIETNKC